MSATPIVLLAGVLSFAPHLPQAAAPDDRVSLADPCPSDASAGGPSVAIGPTTPPRVTRRIGAQYTREAMTADVDAQVRVSLVVHTDGRPCNLRVVRSTPPGLGLEEATLGALRQWRFEPAVRDGARVPVEITVESTFSRLKTRRPEQRAYGITMTPQGVQAEDAFGTGRTARRPRHH